MLIFLLLGYYPWVLLLTWALSFYLTFIEARDRHLDGLRTLWWMLLVFFCIGLVAFGLVRLAAKNSTPAAT